MTDFHDYLNAQKEDPAFRAEWDALEPEFTIIQWWHPYFAPCYRILTGRLTSKVLYICHNVFPHERFPLDRFLTKLTMKRGDYFILHSSKEAEDLRY